MKLNHKMNFLWNMERIVKGIEDRAKAENDVSFFVINISRYNNKRNVDTLVGMSTEIKEESGEVDWLFKITKKSEYKIEYNNKFGSEYKWIEDIIKKCYI